MASLVAGIFGKGGGGEIEVRPRARGRAGEVRRRGGRAVWEDFRSGDDAEAPTTVHGTSFPYLTPPADPAGHGNPRPRHRRRRAVVEETPIPRPRRRGVFGRDDVADRGVERAARLGRRSESGQPLAVMGPQLSYFTPAAVIEMDIHAPGGPEGPAIDARGVAFAGANMYVQLGRGQDYAWSATSAGQDIVDTYALPLCEPGTDPVTLESDHYLYDGECLEFELLERVNELGPERRRHDAGGNRDAAALRTKLGIVTHRGMVDGAPTAFTRLRATYFHEADSAIGFADFNSPKEVNGPADVHEAANKSTTRSIGSTPTTSTSPTSTRAPTRFARLGTDADLPIEGVPANTWQDFDPEAITFDRAPFAGPSTGDRPGLPDELEQPAGARIPRGRREVLRIGSVDRADLLDERVQAGIAGDER